MQEERALKRRDFIQQSALISLGFLALARCTGSVDKGTKTPPDFDLSLKTDPQQYMDLPDGFEYRIISRVGEKMDDGFLVPGRADGMGAFSGPDGKVIVVRNHENSPLPLDYSPFGKKNELLSQGDLAKLYDAGNSEMPGLGGTTTFIYNESTGQVERQYLSLAGTYRNCAGGVTPWNSWLTCEEDVTKKSDKIEKDHGFVFEIPATDQIGIVDPVPITAMGRFNHEAVAVDPKTGIVYQTEDAGNGLFYRYIPEVRGQLHAGGRLQALAIIDQPGLDTRNWESAAVRIGSPLQVRWIDMDDVLSPADDLRLRGSAAGAARFARGEGIWFGEDELYFACTNGGPKRHGQVFRYRTAPGEGTPDETQTPGTLELFAESEDKTVLHMCDNLTIAPWGDVLLCEDNGELNHIRGINRDGKIYDFAVNRSSSSEFAGLVFSPSGKTLFVNIQESGETVAITGPWERFSV
ncbi:alkaline phosphatase PhoX [Flavilitoribacter nigricans]|uniref:Phosphatase n=1 Tax=Flavilitoribacter nigricans (strain ATCC 23147 / DSM 23189 / NBRC 102662 / NCIMB 1420 / SS-2) TaxID=1122177 RepID=A0A2D0MZD9_FLAN2|nr:alkaline phosphatase PhoX [Flavilitoribacter nigricans]PHN01615.1 phosphatase [Flavilitoribacter nigricans DSM 23189 = NBRC 102662]